MSVPLERMRERSRSRQAPVHDWRLTLLPAAIDAGARPRALRLCKALCDRQKGRYPEVFVGTVELAELLGVHRRHINQDTRDLVTAGLLLVFTGGGRMAGSKTGRANVYQLGPVSAPKTVQLSAPKTVQYSRRSRSTYSTENGAPTLRDTSYPSGGSGETTAALTGGSPVTEPSSPAIPPSRFRDLLEKTGLRTRSRVNAT